MVDMQALVAGWAAAWNAGDVPGLLTLFTSDCRYEDVPLGIVRVGHDELAAFAAGFLATIPDARFTIVSCAAHADRAGAEWLMTGTHRGELPGLSRADRPVEIRGMSAFRRGADRLASCVDYWDRADYLRQLGIRG